MTLLDADGRCGNCRGEVTSGGCLRCDAFKVYVYPAYQTGKTVVYKPTVYVIPTIIYAPAVHYL